MTTDNRDKTFSIQEVTKIFEDADGNIRMNISEKLYTSAGISYQTLYQNRNQSNAYLNEYTRVRDKIEDYVLDIELIGAGFDDKGIGHVFSISNPGISSRHDVPGFYATGSGFFGATYMLHFRQAGYKSPLERALYYTYEAKYAAELASGVGNKTDMYVWHSGASPRRVSQTSRKALRRISKKLEAQNFRGTKFEKEVLELPEIAEQII